jgi:Predicted membrane protein (DUF2157)
MNCPKCGNPEQARVRVCPSCGTAYASQDLLELRQLEFLVQATSAWPGTEALRQRYVERLEALRARLVAPATAPQALHPAVPEPGPPPLAPMPVSVEGPQPAAAPARPEPAPTPKPKAEAVPFDQWLLSERNIKFALYTGGLLLVIAGAIFIGANWARIHDLVKFAILVGITAGMYAGGALLYRRPSLRLGGVALLAIASGFLLLDLAVLQIFVFRGLGLDDRAMWLIASLVVMPLYFLTAYKTRASLFTYLGIAAAASAVTAAMALLELPWEAYLLAYSVLAIALLLAAHAVRAWPVADFTSFPLWIVSQIAAPLLFLASIAIWANPNQAPGLGSPWLALAAMQAGVIFYVLTDLIFDEIFARWAACSVFVLTTTFKLIELELQVTEIAFCIAMLAVAYLLAGYAFRRRTSRPGQALPFLAVSQVLAPLVFLVSWFVWISNDLITQPGSPWFALAAMLAVVLFYVLTDLLFHWILARWIAASAFVMTVICLLVQLKIPPTAIGFTLAFVAAAYLLAGYALQRRTNQLDQALPLVVIAHVLASLIFLYSVLLWASPDLFPQPGSPWFALAAMFAVALFCVLTDLLFQWILARWVAAFALAATIVCILFQLEVSLAASSFTLLFLSLAFLLVGWFIRHRTDEIQQALPLYAAGYAAAVFSTLQVGVVFEQNLTLLAQVLTGDVILLAVSAVLHRQVAWAYGAAWLFIAPVAIYAQVYLDSVYQVGLALSGLLAVYAATGYLAGRRTLRLGGAFLSAAAFLSLVVVPLVWVNSTGATLILGAIAALYLLFAVWLGWPWLLAPALAALHLAVITGLDIFYSPASPWDQALTLAYAVAGVIMLLAGIYLRRTNRVRWAWPLLAFAALDLAGTFLSSLLLGGWLPVVLSAVYAILAFWLAWTEDRFFTEAKLGPVLTYLGAALLFTGHFYALALAGLAWTAWPPVTALLCALMVAASWFFRQGQPGRIYGTPLHRTGLGLLLVPLLWIVLVTNTEAHHIFALLAGSTAWPFSLIQLVTFAIASCVYFADGAIRRNPLLIYLGGGALVVALWSALMYYQVSELQAYVLPLGLGLVLAGWNERRLGRTETYRWATLFGLLLLMGTAFYQSFEAPVYAALLLVESALALGLGIRIRSRGYVIVGGLALVANALVQFGSAFIELDRWIQIGVIGSLLLGGGLLALFRRDRIITARRHFTEDWKKWQP